MLKFPHRWLIACFMISALMLTGCPATQGDSAKTASPMATGAAASPTTPEASPTDQTTTSPASPVNSQTQGAAMSNLPRLDGKATIVMTVKGSPITIEVDGTNAPVTAGNFVDLVQRGVYDGLVFHRVVREPEPFVVQGGDPQGKDPKVSLAMLGTGGFIDPETKQPRQIPLEIKPVGETEPVYSKTLRQSGITKAPLLSHKRGALAMARSAMPDSASSQFYFTLADLPFLDGDYAVFGTVTAGMDVVDKIQQGDRIESAKITQGADNLKTGK
jgi:peptidyl-prolyl cis-trans isomerase B (cyclophilin B)